MIGPEWEEQASFGETAASDKRKTGVLQGESLHSPYQKSYSITLYHRQYGEALKRESEPSGPEDKGMLWFLYASKGRQGPPHYVTWPTGVTKQKAPGFFLQWVTERL